MTPLPTAKQRVLKALQSGPKLTAELMLVGGRNFPARLEELKRIDGIDHISERVSQSSWRYRLVTDSPKWPGPFVVCTRCSHSFIEPGHSTACQLCGAGAHWLEEHVDKAVADRRAALVDPAKVAEELAFLQRQRSGGRAAA